MRRPKKDIQLTSYDELLGLEETPEKSMNQVVEIDLTKPMWMATVREQRILHLMRMRYRPLP